MNLLTAISFCMEEDFSLAPPPPPMPLPELKEIHSRYEKKVENNYWEPKVVWTVVSGILFARFPTVEHIRLSSGHINLFL